MAVLRLTAAQARRFRTRDESLSPHGIISCTIWKMTIPLDLGKLVRATPVRYAAAAVAAAAILGFMAYQTFSASRPYQRLVDCGYEINNKGALFMHGISVVPGDVWLTRSGDSYFLGRLFPAGEIGTLSGKIEVDQRNPTVAVTNPDHNVTYQTVEELVGARCSKPLATPSRFD